MESILKKDKLCLIEKWIRRSLGLLALLLAAFGGFMVNADLLLAATLLLWLHNMVYALERFKDRVVFFLFHCAIFFFTLGGDMIDWILGNAWKRDYRESTLITALLLVLITMLFLWVGSSFMEIYFHRKKDSGKKEEQENLEIKERFLKYLRLFSLAAFLVSVCFLFVSEIDKLIFMHGKEYIQFYSEYKPQVPGLVVSLGALAPYALCLYLATLPSKKQSLVPLLLYVASGVPVFLVGQRNRVVSNVLLVFVYYVLRHYLGKPKGKIWIGKIEKVALVILVPLGLVFLSLYAQLRVGQSTEGLSFGNAIVELLRSQSVTFDVVYAILDWIPQLPPENFCYTLGPLINYFANNFIGQALFHTSPLPMQSVEYATRGNSMQDTISYLVMGDKYLQGGGMGSSYTAELYVDFGFAGLALFSVLLGGFFIWFAKRFGKNVWETSFLLILSINLFMMPRSSALGWLVPALYVPMLVMFVVLGMAAWGANRLFKGGFFRIRGVHSPIKPKR